MTRPDISRPDINGIDVIAPNFKRRLSGVTSTVVRLVPLQARQIAIAAAAPALPEEVPQVPLASLLTMSRRGPSGARVWHARRNVEMIAGLALKHLLRKRLRLMFTSASQREHTGLTKWLIRRMEAVVATSARTAAYLERDAVVILHGIDTDQFSPSEDRAALRRRLGLPEGAVIAGCYGRIRAQKGTDVFVEALLHRMDRDPDLVGVVMGRATEKHQGFERELKARIAARGHADRLLFKPEVPVWEMADWYRALDLYIAPQRWEGFGLTPLEAMSCGVPVLATRVGAFEELVSDGETGALVAPDDIPGMTRAADALLSDRAALAALGRKARAQALSRFRIEDEAAALVAIYRNLLAKG
ncbi:glycosyltransferase family 4 protein [Primorskyibacter flagellatus]|uniref:glycosyltransferase family 4 protein n=1 Tax=Primorskyibacter flagellatus TaxID=1387277 RepID=UPI001663E2C1|nr:glycosyltransferase family 4 protein [Primorskyibacter flagellatus]